MIDPLTGKRESNLWDLHRCPAHHAGAEWVDVVRTWSVFGGRDDWGPLPVAGGWLDQTQWFADAHRILSAERERLIDMRQKDAEREREAAARKAKGRH